MEPTVPATRSSRPTVLVFFNSLLEVVFSDEKYR